MSERTEYAVRFGGDGRVEGPFMNQWARDRWLESMARFGWVPIERTVSDWRAS